MRRRLFVFLSLLVLGATLTGCGAKEAGKGTAAASTSGVTASAGQSGQKASTPKKGQSANADKITGSAEDIQKMLNGIRNDSASITTDGSGSSNADSPVFNDINSLLQDDSVPSDVQ